MQQHFPIFTATPHGILVDGLPLAKSFSKDVSPQARCYVTLAEELLKQVKPEDWDNRMPHDAHNIPTLAKAQMLLALASPQPMETFHKYRDDQTDNHIVLNSSPLQTATGSNYYFTHDSNSGGRNSQIQDFIDSLPEGTTVNIIGHSWGGDTAANVAVQNPNRVETLVTVDPVSQFNTPDFNDVKTSVRNWVNIYATGKSGRITIGDISAFIGGSWGTKPNRYATVPLTSDTNHEDFDSMLQNTTYNGGNTAYNSKTPYQILNSK